MGMDDVWAPPEPAPFLQNHDYNRPPPARLTGYLS